MTHSFLTVTATKGSAVILVLLLAGCAGQNVGRDLLLACHAYDGALSSLTVYRAAGRLSEGQIATVNQVRAVANPICMGEPLDLRTALTALETELRRMAVIELEKKQ